MRGRDAGKKVGRYWESVAVATAIIVRGEETERADGCCFTVVGRVGEAGKDATLVRNGWPIAQRWERCGRATPQRNSRYGREWSRQGVATQ